MLLKRAWVYVLVGILYCSCLTVPAHALIRADIPPILPHHATYEEGSDPLYLFDLFYQEGHKAPQLGSYAHIVFRSSYFPAITVAIAEKDLPKLAATPGIHAIEPVVTPVYNADFPIEGLIIQEGPGTDRAASPTCQAYAVESNNLHTITEVQEYYGIKGKGTTIAVISDSYNKTTSGIRAEDDISNGFLPGATNPCGYTQEVQVIAESTLSSATDEGRAMLQIIHGVAPEANLAFATAGLSPLTMAENIMRLHNETQAKIIVDDVGWTTQSPFQSDYIAAAITMVRQAGVEYISSAGNKNINNAQGNPVGSWQTRAYRPMTCPEWVFRKSAVARTSTCLDFDPTEAEQAYDIVQFNWENSTSSTINAMFAVGGHSYLRGGKYALQFYSDTDNPELLTEIFDDQYRRAVVSQAFSPDVIAKLKNHSSIRLVFVREEIDRTFPYPAIYIGSPDNSLPIADRQFNSDYSANGIEDRVGETSVGHAGTGGSIAVGAALAPHLRYNGYTLTNRTQPYLAYFSTIGEQYRTVSPAQWSQRNRTCYGWSNFGVFSCNDSPLATPEIINGVSILAATCTQTSFFGSNYIVYDYTNQITGIQKRFCGTSASAPFIAGILGLAYSYAPNIPIDTLQNLLYQTADTITNPYPNKKDELVQGAGFANALALFQKMDEDHPSALSAHAPYKLENIHSTVHARTAEISWDKLADTYHIHSYRIKINQEEIEETHTEIISITNLEAGSTYTITITAINDWGQEVLTDTITITTLQEAPQLEEGTHIDYANEKITAAENYELSTDGITWTTETVDIAPGSYIYLRKVENGQVVSEQAHSTLPARPEAPELSIKEITEDSVELALKDSDNTDIIFRKIDADNVEQEQKEPLFIGLTPGETYTFGAKKEATDKSFASEWSEITLLFEKPETPSTTEVPSSVRSALPNELEDEEFIGGASISKNIMDHVHIDFKEEKILLDSGYAIRTADGAIFSGEIADLGQLIGHKVTVYSADGEEESEYTIPSRAQMSALSVSNGVLSGLDPAYTYEYQEKGSDTWVEIPAGTSSIEMPYGSYNIRIAAGEDYFSSEAQEYSFEETPPQRKNRLIFIILGILALFGGVLAAFAGNYTI